MGLKQNFASHCSLQFPRLEFFGFDDVMLRWNKARGATRTEKGRAGAACVMGYVPAEAKHICVAGTSAIVN